MGIFSKILILFIMVLTFCSGCHSTVDIPNASTTTRQMIDYLVWSGLPVESIQPVRSDLINANEGVAAKIGTTEIGVYKYNLQTEKSRKKLEYIEENGFVYISGRKFQAFCCGTFVFLGVEKSDYRDQILKALDDFTVEKAMTASQVVLAKTP